MVMAEFGHLYEQQYAVALFNKVRFDMEGGGGPQPQLLQRKVRDSLSPLRGVILFSVNIETVHGGHIKKALSRVSHCNLHSCACKANTKKLSFFKEGK